MKRKLETGPLIKSFVQFVETQFDAKVKCIRSDNEAEFKLDDFYPLKGILHKMSYVETPQQNCTVERKHQHIMGVARALMFQSGLLKSLWNYAVGHVLHLINRLRTRFLTDQSPYAILHSFVPNVSNLKVFGCLSFASTLQAKRKKLYTRARKCVFLGFKIGTKGFLLYDLNSR